MGLWVSSQVTAHTYTHSYFSWLWTSRNEDWRLFHWLCSKSVAPLSISGSHLYDLVSSAHFPLPAAQLRKTAPCYFFISSATLISPFSIFLLPLVFILVHYFFTLCVNRSCLHTPNLWLVFRENLFSWNKWCIWNPVSVHTPGCAFSITRSSFQVYTLLQWGWCFGQGPNLYSF